MSKDKGSEKSENVIRIAAETAAKTAIEVWEKENNRRRQESSDRRLHNTKLLLRNYRAFKIQAESAIYDARALDESAYEILELMMEGKNEDMVIDSIRKSAIRTAIIIEHIDRMIEFYSVLCERSKKENDVRNCRLIYDFYINPTPYSAKELAERENIAERTVYANIDSAIETLTVLLFGVDAAKL